MATFLFYFLKKYEKLICCRTHTLLLSLSLELEMNPVHCSWMLWALVHEHGIELRLKVAVRALLSTIILWKGQQLQVGESVGFDTRVG